MSKISKIELMNAISMYLDSKQGVDNIYTGITIESCEQLIDIYESARDTRKSNVVKLWKHMIKWDCQRHKQTRSWFISMIEAVNDINKTGMTNPKGNDRIYYIANKDSMYDKALKEAYNECKPTGYMTGIVPKELPKEYDLDYICIGENLLNWIKDRAENDEVLRIEQLSDVKPKTKSTPNITVKNAFTK